MESEKGCALRMFPFLNLLSLDQVTARVTKACVADVDTQDEGKELCIIGNYCETDASESA